MLPFQTNRRKFLNWSGAGFAGLAASAIWSEEKSQQASDSRRSVIFLFMSGGPSQVDTFDPKPALATLAGKDVPQSIAETVPKIKRAGLKHLLPSPWKFQKHGESGMDVSELFPSVAKHVDKLCLIRSMQHRNPVHGPAECVALTGTATGDRPSLGAWTLYGMGREANNLPDFLAMNLLNNGMQFPQVAGWSSGFLPPAYQATVVDPKTGIRFSDMPKDVTTKSRTKQLNLLRWLNDKHKSKLVENSELDARIKSYELAFRMQTSAPELFDLSGETKQIKTLYGFDEAESRTVGHGCLLARRMVERGVRFVQIRVGGWDAHGNLAGNHSKMARQTDKPIAALLQDLQQRGLLDSTLVVWGGEFGRTPTMEGRANGRDHSPAGYSMWLAGAGVQGGKIIGATDPIGYVVIDRPVSPADFHATVLAGAGLDPNKVVYQHHGRQEKATVFDGEVVAEVFQS